MPDSGGPGAHRGGMAQVLEFRSTSPDAFVTARNRDRSIFQPWAILGGMPGKSGSFTLNPDTSEARDLGNIDTVRLGPGEVLRIVSPSGAGRGDPFLRAPEAVLRDWQAGRISVQGALQDYGVVLADGRVQAAETSRKRHARAHRHSFDPGPARVGHEQRWTPESYAELHTLLDELPVSWRAPVKKRLFAAVRTAPSDESTIAVVRTPVTKLSSTRAWTTKNGMDVSQLTRSSGSRSMPWTVTWCSLSSVDLAQPTYR